MNGQRIGYIRVSSVDQNPERQLEGVQLDRTFTDKVSGKDTRRPDLESLLAFVREGDTVAVHSMDRLARNLDDLRRIVKGLTGRGVRVEFVKEGLVFTGEDSPMANLMLSTREGSGRCRRSGPGSCGGGPPPARQRPPWPGNSASAARRCTNT